MSAYPVWCVETQAIRDGQMKRKWPGVTKQLQILNNGLREQYDDIVSDIRRVVKEAEAGYHRGAFDKALDIMVTRHLGSFGEDDEWLDRWVHGFNKSATSMDVTKQLCGEDDSSMRWYLWVTFYTGKKLDKQYSIPITTGKDEAGARFRIPDFIGVEIDANGVVDDFKFESRMQRMADLLEGLREIATPMMRIVMGEAKEQRYRIRDMINGIAVKHHIDEAIYKEATNELAGVYEDRHGERP